MQTKPFYQSKTLWTQLLAVLSLLIPSVQEWVATNPVEFGAVFAAINTIVRFVTKGAIEPFKDSFNGKTSLLAVGMLGMAMAFGCGLSSCSSGSPLDVEGKIYYRDENSGAKGGLDFVSGEKPKFWWRVPVLDGGKYDLGDGFYAEIKQPEIDPAK